MVWKACEECDERLRRAALLRDAIMETWRPPLLAVDQCEADIAQTSVMQALGFVFGRDFFTGLSDNQAQAVDQGLAMMADLLEGK